MAAEPKTAPISETETMAFAYLQSQWAKLQEILVRVEREVCIRTKIEPCKVDWQTGRVVEVLPPPVAPVKPEAPKPIVNQ